MGYGQPTAATWKNSEILPSSCIALAEVVNVPKEFVSHNPYYVVQDTNWIMWYDNPQRLYDARLTFIKSLPSSERQPSRG